MRKRLEQVLRNLGFRLYSQGFSPEREDWEFQKGNWFVSIKRYRTEKEKERWLNSE